MAAPLVPYAPPGPDQPRVRDRLGRQLLIVALLAAAATAAGLTGSRRGWAAVGLAWLLVAVLGAHRAAGGLWLARMICEYALVAVLVVLVVTTLHPTPDKPTRPAAANPAAAAAAGQLCPPPLDRAAGGLCARLEQLRDWVTTQTTTTPTTPRSRS